MLSDVPVGSYAVPGAHFGAPGAHLGAHLGAPGAHLGAPGAHLGAPGAHLGAQGAQLGARGAHLGAHIGAHLGENESHLRQIDDTTNAENKPVILHHPFTMMISGPTACGKTTFIKSLLQHHTTRIQPDIERIVWLYKIWQPLYSVIQRSVLPQVEFVQGIPSDLEDDDFFDPRLNNLLSLDDLFSEAGKDRRITDLFTEGSHHRSLSVISINQNLFANKDPTQRRNCHYLVLFNNPVDRQSVMTLARQMYPGNTEKFQKAFTKATRNPYWYLLVDLTPFTSENDRLKYDIEWSEDNLNQDINVLTSQMQERKEDSIKDLNVGSMDHLSVGAQTVHIKDTSETEDEMAEMGHACDDCGLLFYSPYDIQRHVKRGWCPENREPPSKRAKLEDEIDDDVEDNEGYKHLWHLAQTCNKDRFSKLYDQYVDDGENEDDATDMTTQQAQPYAEKKFFERYRSLLEVYWFPLLTNTTHRAIVEQISAVKEPAWQPP